MTIYDLKDVSVDSCSQKVEVYDSEKEYETIYSGYLEDVPDEIAEKEISTIDICDKTSDYIGINI